MYLAGAWSKAATAVAATTKMIVVSADDDVLFLQNRIGAFQDADDVVGRRFAANHVRRKC